jgi:hypothetical protein
MRAASAIALGFIGVLAATAMLGHSNASASPGLTSDCTGCHSYRGGSLRVTTNTNSLTVAPGASFAVSISFTGGGSSRTEVNWPNVQNNTLFTPTPRVPFSAMASSTTTSSTLTAPATPGTYTVRVYATQKNPTMETDYKDMTITVAAPAPTTYAISVSASPAEGGVVSGGGTFASGTSVSIMATPNSGYHFVSWTAGTAVVSTSASYSFTCTAARTLVANFATNTYSLSYSAGPNGSLTGTVSQTVNYGASGTAVTAVPSTGYHFVNWSDGSTANPRTDTNVASSISVTANFAVTPATTYAISVSASPAAGGVVSGGGTFASGASVSLLATANSGYHFVNWTEGTAVVSTSASYSFTCTAARTLVANFGVSVGSAEAIYSISVSAMPSVGGTATGGGAYDPGASATVLATANRGYHFVNWTENGVQVSTSLSYSFTVGSNRTLVANFAIDTHSSHDSEEHEGHYHHSDDHRHLSRND